MNTDKGMSPRFIFDLQILQNPAFRNRGIGRYSSSLFFEFAKCVNNSQLFALLLKEQNFLDELSFLNPKQIMYLPEMPNWKSAPHHLGGNKENLDGVSYNSFVQMFKPDVIHVSFAFEEPNSGIALPSARHITGGQILSATLHDLIPLVYPEQYLPSRESKRWYHNRCSWLRQVDLIFAISEATRQDAINLIGIDPRKIVTIHGGYSAHFKPVDDLKKIKSLLKERFPLNKKMVLYVGGDDFRKNIYGAIKGFSLVPKEVRKDTTLFIVCDISETNQEMYRTVAFKLGLTAQDICFTGYVPESDLMAFYAVCDLFIFPSKYEGFGLPVLEAMACGAAVIAGNNSSLKEIVQLEDALFDANSDDSIALILTKALSNPNYLQMLREHGIERSKDYSWENSAKIMVDTYHESLSQKQSKNIQVALNGCTSRKKKLAILTPLPPVASGIADYSLNFIPYLERYFEIDLYIDGSEYDDNGQLATCNVYNAREFPSVASSYDAILYEIGNSAYHYFMIPYLFHFEGIVSLHDAFLGNLFYSTSRSKRDFLQQILKSHNSQLIRKRLSHSTSDEEFHKILVDLPCSKPVLDRAIGIISHTSYNLKIAESFYPKGWNAPYRVIPQITKINLQRTLEQYRESRTELGLEQDAFVIATFGHIASYKMGILLLDAVINSGLIKLSNVRLIYVGKLNSEKYALELESLAKKYFSTNKIFITEYVSSEKYKKYLHATDIAVQLRKNSRGGTPKGVMDCLTHGVPVIVNNDASYKDYPDDVVIKLSSDPSIEEVASALRTLYDDRQKLSGYSLRGKDYIERHHNPFVCAAQYAVTINEFIERHLFTKKSYWAEVFAPYFSSCSEPELAISYAQKWLQELPSIEYKRSRIFIDVSHIAKQDFKTGIQRVVRSLVPNLYSLENAQVDVLAVELKEGKLCVADQWLHSQGLILKEEISDSHINQVIFDPGDQLVMLDSSWERYKEFYPVFVEARKHSVTIVTVVYDILPIQLPNDFIPGGKAWFENWLKEALSQSDKLLCISKATADAVLSYAKQYKLGRENLQVGYWHLGSDFNQEKISDQRNTIESVPFPYLLMVGTIEPRKSHRLALQVMEILWNKGVDLNLCIVGKKGWEVEDLMKRIQSHPMLDKKLFYSENISDMELASFYKHSQGLLFFSKGEGFGLPLIEAANFGIPIICSDISVFHEIVGDFATYVNLDDGPETIALQLVEWWEKCQNGEVPSTFEMTKLSWNQSASSFLEQLQTTNNWFSLRSYNR